MHRRLHKQNSRFDPWVHSLHVDFFFFFLCGATKRVMVLKKEPGLYQVITCKSLKSPTSTLSARQSLVSLLFSSIISLHCFSFTFHCCLISVELQMVKMTNIRSKKWKNKKKVKKKKTGTARKHETSAKTHDCCVNVLVLPKEFEVQASASWPHLCSIRSMCWSRTVSLLGRLQNRKNPLML